MQLNDKVQHVYLVGAKSLGAYGGYETFVYKLTEYHQNKENIKYHVACKANGDGCMDESKFEGVTKINDHEFELHNAHCFKIDVPQIGPAQAIYYDVAALKTCCEHIKKNHIPHPIVYIMACRIGPFAAHFYKEIHKLGGTVFLNPDGHEWMRARWAAPIRKYWKISEQMMVKYCDLAICDSVNIEKYIHECYDGKGIKGRNPQTTFIAYGADLTLSKLTDDDEKLVNWYKGKGLTKKGYYLVVGRFVPENSFEVMIREFMKSESKKDFAIITNVNLLQLILLLVLEMHIFLLKKDLMRFTRKLRFHSTTFSLWDLVVASELWALQKRSFRSSLDRDTIKWLDCYISFRPSLLLSALVIAWVRSTTRHAESEKRVQTT